MINELAYSTNKVQVNYFVFPWLNKFGPFPDFPQLIGGAMQIFLGGGWNPQPVQSIISYLTQDNK